MAFFGPASLLMRIMLDAKYGIYPTVIVTALSEWRITSNP